jgi:pimeloyl-ACP methyl ester carboxylesterase
MSHEPTFVDVSGCRLAYEVSGEGAPVLFIQGVGIHGRGWTPQVLALGSEFRCATFDNRGMGRSQPNDGAITVEQMAQDAFCILDQLDWPSCHVVAHSLGGLVALEMALAHRERVRSLSLLCTLARGKDATRLTKRMLWLGVRSRIGTRRMRRRAFLEIVMPPGAVAADEDKLAAELEPLFGHDLADQPPVAMKQLAALRAYDATDRLQQLSGLATLVVSAEHDPIAPPAYGRLLAQGIAGARFVEFPDASHGVPIQNAAEINLLLQQHLRAAEHSRA